MFTGQQHISRLFRHIKPILVKASKDRKYVGQRLAMEHCAEGPNLCKNNNAIAAPLPVTPAPKHTATPDNNDNECLSITQDRDKSSAISRVLRQHFVTVHELAQCSRPEIDQLFGKTLGLHKTVLQWWHLQQPKDFNETIVVRDWATQTQKHQDDPNLVTLQDLKNDIDSMKISLSILLKKDGITGTYQQKIQTNFFDAVATGDLEKARMYWERYKNMILINGFSASSGETVLIKASQMGYLEVVHFLVQECHANIHETAMAYPNRTALMAAASEHRYQIVEYLLRLGAAVDERDQDGKTAYGLAADNEILIGSVVAKEQRLRREIMPNGAATSARRVSHFQPADDFEAQKISEENFREYTKQRTLAILREYGATL